jgi:DNA (cytosine-5)-methyltransferase 1
LPASGTLNSLLGVTLLKPRSNTKPIRALSLFTGAGGLDIGFHRVGFDVQACVEMEPVFCETLERNRSRYLRPNCKIINKDIRELKPNEIGMPKCDFIIGGPPCQSFSAAGRRAGGIAGVNDSRGSLFEHYCRLIDHFRPRGFLFENVRGILSANKGRDWDQILAAFRNLGYQVSHRVLDAADFGVPQHRERLILVGALGEDAFRFPRPTHGPDSVAGAPFVSCGQAIADLQDPNEPVHEYDGKYGELLAKVPPGMNYHFFTKELGYPNPIFAWRSRFSDFLYKAHFDHPTKTIVARPGKYSGPFHWKNRTFTFAEFKRLFTFPDDYTFAGSNNTALQQLGNSVAPAFAEGLASAVAVQLFQWDVAVELLSPDRSLSFDRRKGAKARKTRRQTVANKHAERTLFDAMPTADAREEILVEKIYFCGYSSWKQRRKDAAPFKTPSGLLFQITERFMRGEARIAVVRLKDGNPSESQLISYQLRFLHPIGDGLQTISCDIYSDCEEDMVAAWDAIEDSLCSHSNYGSLVEVFGHFTEPHPIFRLEMVPTPATHGFLLQFAKYFSDFSKIAVDFPASLMESFFHPAWDANFRTTVQRLRSMRFDVRVFETNTTIEPGYFRCCYPFPLHVDKQVSIRWVDRLNGNPPGISRADAGVRLQNARLGTHSE